MERPSILLSSEEFGELYRAVSCFLRTFKNMDLPALLEFIKKLQEDHLDINECLDFMQLWYRDILMYKVTKDMNLLIFKDEYKTISEISESQLLRRAGKDSAGHRQGEGAPGCQCETGIWRWS